MSRNTMQKSVTNNNPLFSKQLTLTERVRTKLFFNSDSWELEKYYRANEILDRIFLEKLVKLHENEDGRCLRAKNLVDKTDFIKNSFVPVLKQYTKENMKHHSKSVNKYLQYENEINQHMAEINYRNHEIDFLIEVEDDLESRVKRYKRTRRFLRKTVEESSGRFNSISTLLDRFIYLLEAKENIIHKMIVTNEKIQDSKQKLENISLENESELVKLMNQMREILIKKDEQEKRIQQLKDKFLQAHEEVFNNTLVIGQIQLGISNLYLKLSEKLDQLPKAETHKEQLRYIQIALSEIKKLNKTIHDVIKPESSVANNTAALSGGMDSSITNK